MQGIAQTKTRFGSGNHRWMGDLHGLDTTEGVTLDGSLFGAASFPDGLVQSGTILGKVTATGLYGPYGELTEEVQTATVTGAPTGGTFTLTYSGQTTTAIAYNASATAVKAALVALSNIGADDVAVSGADGGPYTVTFQGSLANTNVAQMTATASLTGGTTPGVTIATTTAGGAAITPTDGRQVARGHLVSDQVVAAGKRNDGALYQHGTVITTYLPANSGYVVGVATDLPQIRYRTA